jgi:hypothetical protein
MNEMVILLPFKSRRIIIVGELKKIEPHDMRLRSATYYLWKSNVATQSVYFKMKLTLKIYKLIPSEKAREKKAPYFMRNCFKGLYKIY